MIDDDWQTPVEAAAGQPGAAPHLCFNLGEQSYALPVGQVQEIRAMGRVSRLPGSPPWLVGVMNLRGQVIPVSDLRLRFSIPLGAWSLAPVLIVVITGGKLAGLVVDGVLDVADLPPDSLRPPGEDRRGEAACVTGVASLGDAVVIVLDAAPLLGLEAMGPEAARAAMEVTDLKGIENVAVV